MSFIGKRFFFFLVFIGLLVGFPPKMAFADDNFTVSYDLTYSFINEETTQVTQKTSLTNKKTNLYPTNYQMVISGKVEGEISGFDDNGPLTISSQKEGENKLKIEASFNQKRVGLGNQQTFTLNYLQKDLISKVGRIKEISIPKAGNLDTLDSYQTRVVIPKVFGPIAYVKPKVDISQSGNNYILVFDNEKSREGALIGIGDVAVFNFEISYQLKNRSLIQREAEIALPPDTAYQQLIYRSIEPPPKEVNIDRDGNWLASYDLLPQQQISILAKGSVLLYTTPRENFSESPPLASYLSGNKYWEVEDEEIKNLASKLQNPEEIYNYVVSNLKYNYSRINNENSRLGALAVFKKPDDAICMEFTDLFVTLSRARGIASREIEGYAYTQDQYLKPLSLIADVLHAWPEYWDEKNEVWVPVDPTWGNTTKLDYFNNWDFSHFTFVRHGTSSTSPLPAGSYRFTEETKNVEITPSSDLPEIPQSEIDFSFEIPKKIVSGGSLEIIITTKNNGGVAKYDIPLEIEASGFTIDNPDKLINLPPFSAKATTVKLEQNQKKIWGKVPITINVAGQKKTVEVDIQPFEYPVFIICSILFLLLIAVLGYKLLQRRKA